MNPVGCGLDAGGGPSFIELGGATLMRRGVKGVCWAPKPKIASPRGFPGEDHRPTSPSQPRVIGAPPIPGALNGPGSGRGRSGVHVPVDQRAAGRDGF
ncbi:MAG: hypothetical protein CM15mP79_1450 [Methanobacteriota archaeon]|nr:MAG: hypothetical protein CM15mP79_1450 [Euryarchaeota archaeon]